MAKLAEVVASHDDSTVTAWLGKPAMKAGMIRISRHEYVLFFDLGAGCTNVFSLCYSLSCTLTICTLLHMLCMLIKKF